MDKNAIKTPNNIEVLLHCYVSPNPHPRVRAASVQESLNAFLEIGAIEPSGGETYRTTPLGDAWVKALCNVPIPRAAFVDESGKILA